MDINYLGYVITREEVNPNSKKTRGIMDLQRPKTTTDFRKIAGMIQYYQAMWKRLSHILVPITEASVGEKVKKI